MPGVYQQSADQIVEEAREVESLGIPGIILFGLPESKGSTRHQFPQRSGVWSSEPLKRFEKQN